MFEVAVFYYRNVHDRIENPILLKGFAIRVSRPTPTAEFKVPEISENAILDKSKYSCRIIYESICDTIYATAV